MLFFVVTGAIFNNYTKIPFYLFFLALALKSFSLNIIFTLISIYLFKTQYLYYIPIALNFLLYNQNDKPIYLSSVINNVNKYLKLIENKSNNMDSYDTIDERIKALLKSYCLNCPMKEKCFSKRRTDMYHFLMYEVTSNMKHSKEIDYFIYNCEYKKMMDEAPKINFNLNSSYNTIKDTINILISENNLKNDLIAKLKNYSLSSINYINDSQMTLSFNEYILPLKLERILKNKNLNVSYTGNNTYEIAYKSKCKIKAESIILSKGGGYIAGDNCLIKKNSTKLYAALSDGMGSGLKAYEASKALLKRLEGLINLPYDDEKIIRLLTELSHISLFTSSYATLDFFSANLATKKGKLFKIASSTSLLIRNNQIKEFNTKTLPIDFDGILDLYLNVVDGLVVYDKVIEKRLMSELPFMATENIMMDAVKAGGDRQELHEKIRELSMEAGKNVKEKGLDNNLLELIANDPAFNMSLEDLQKTMDPSKYVGRSPEQVDEFLAEVINPILEENKEILGMSATINV